MQSPECVPHQQIKAINHKMFNESLSKQLYVFPDNNNATKGSNKGHLIALWQPYFSNRKANRKIPTSESRNRLIPIMVRYIEDSSLLNQLSSQQARVKLIKQASDISHLHPINRTIERKNLKNNEQLTHDDAP